HRAYQGREEYLRRVGRHHRQRRQRYARQLPARRSAALSVTAMFTMLSRYLSRFRRDQRGAVIVEMTLITRLMLVLSAGVFEFGNLIHDKLLMEAGLTDAARYAARCN